MPAAAIGAVASVAGGAIAASGAKSAAKTQAAATREANEIQRQQYEQTRSDLGLYRNYGSAATGKLAQLLGLDLPVETTTSGLTREQLRAQLLPQFTSKAAAPDVPGWSPIPGMPGGPTYDGNAEGGQVSWGGGPAQAPDVIDEAGLSAAIDRQFAEAQAQANAARQSPDFGSLLKNFTGEDLETEPGFIFQRDQGQKALDSRLAAAGSYFSGNALKAAARYNQDFAGTKYNEAFQRDSANKRRAFDFLSGAVNTGQNSAAMTGSAGTAMAQQVGANTTAMGNAAGAAGIAQGGAWGNALQNAATGYRQSQMVDSQNEQNALLRTAILGGNSGWSNNESWRTTGSGMPDWYQ